MTLGATEAGVILGTAAYMAPEQARGRTVDKRADIWAFGAVLYEMLTGRVLFRGETVSDIMVEVLGKEPDLSALPLTRATLSNVAYARTRASVGKPSAMFGSRSKKEWRTQVRRAPLWKQSEACCPGLLQAHFCWCPGHIVYAWRATRSASGVADLPLMRFDTDLGPDA